MITLATGEDFISVAEAAAILGVHVRTVRYYIQKGRLLAYKRLGQVLVKRGDVEALGRVQPLSERGGGGDAVHE